VVNKIVIALILVSLIGFLLAAEAPQQTKPNLAQQAVNDAMIEACKGAAKMRFDQAMVGREIDVDGFRAICIKLRNCRDKLYQAVEK